MAFTSFTVRNTINDNGSALRRTKVTQDLATPNGSGDGVADSGLRADGFFPPVPESFLESTFEANVYSRTKIALNWTLGFTIVETPGEGTEPVEVLIRASSTGEPITAGDGDRVISVTYNDYLLNYDDENPLYIKEGSWVYYSMFVRYEDSAGDGFYERVATLSVQIPRDFNSTEDLWSRIPEYYRSLDTDYALKTEDYSYAQGPLHRYVELFGWELDKMRTTIYDTMRINDPEVVHSSAINALANQSGVEFTKEALGTSKLRAVLNNIGYLRRTKGTEESVGSYISALSGCGVSTETTLNEETWISNNVFGTSIVNGVAYGNGRWVAVGAGGKTSTSTNGTTWTATTTVGNTRLLSSVAYGNGIFVAVGTSASNSATPCIYTSTNGTTWTAVFNSASTGYYLLRDVAYANGMWVAVGVGIGPSNTVLLCTSPDGTTWTIKSTGITGAYQLTNIAFGNGKWIATSTSQQLVISTDNGSTWTASLPATLPASQYTAIGYADGVWVIALSNFVYRSLDNAVTWVYSTKDSETGEVTGFDKINDIWLLTGTDGDVWSSTDDGDTWYQIYLQGAELFDIAVGGKSVTVIGNQGYIANNYLLINFNVHPMRVNLFTDPFFSQSANKPISADTDNVRRQWTDLTSGSGRYGWGVYALFSEIPPSAMTVVSSDDTMTITFPAMTGTVSLDIYSRGKFSYNNNLTYYYSAESSHDFIPRFISDYWMVGAMEDPVMPVAREVVYFDDWNGTASFSTFNDFLTNSLRKIVPSIPQTTGELPNDVNVVPAYTFSIALSAGSPTTVTFKNPLVEYKNSSGSFFSGDEPLGGFIQDPTGAVGAGLYDYHWGTSPGTASGTDFSYYTLDEHRVQKVVDNIIENYIVPVTIVKGRDYKINWNVLE
jgi:hypothetical protein